MVSLAKDLSKSVLFDSLFFFFPPPMDICWGLYFLNHGGEGG